MQLTGKVAIVTGAAGGIGAAVGRRFVAEGAAVVFADLDGPRVEATVAEVLSTSPERASAFSGDLSSSSVLAALIEHATETFGPGGVFHANAAVGGLGGLDTSESEWDLAWQVNTMAHVRAARLLVDGWVSR